MRPSTSPSPRRAAAVRIIAIVMALSAIGFGLFTIVFGIVGPSQVPHAFHNAVVASLLVVISAPAAIAVARSPTEAGRALVVLAVLAIAGLATMAASVTIDPFTMPFVVSVGLLWALAPSRVQLRPSGRPSPILLVIVLAASIPLVGYAYGNAELQRTDATSAHDAFFHWVETSFYAIAALGLGLLTAMRPSAHRLAAWSGGVAIVVLGAASLWLEGYASSLPSPWGWAALVGGIAFIAVADWEARGAGSPRAIAEN